MEFVRIIVSLLPMKETGSPKKKGLLFRWLLRILFGLAVCCVLLVLLFKWVPVRYTPVMLVRSVEYRHDPTFHTQKTWMPLDQFSPALLEAVIQTEDRLFGRHHGFDFGEIRKMWKEHREEGAPIRGCSTISQQTAKNVFTFGSPSIVRKVLEVGWTLLIEWIWGKQRILEVYLNVVETGKGLYGFETAAQVYYGIPASELDVDQSLAIASCLHNPTRYSPLDEPDEETRSKIAQRKRWIETARARNRFPSWIYHD